MENIKFPILCSIVFMFLWNVSVFGNCAKKPLNNGKQKLDICNVLLSVTLSPISCHGANNGSITITATQGNSPYQFSIDGGNTYQSFESFMDLSDGEYSIKVKDQNNCTASASATLLNPEPIYIDLGAAQNTYSGEEILLDAGSGYSNYSWSTGESTQTLSFVRITDQEIIENISVSVTDKNGCVGTLNLVEVTILPKENEDPLNEEDQINTK